ncbi:MAG TPA: hypothetical protein P5137_12245 [Candidatus Brocadiia bacterium]|nr:hypothetical protein [Candidatus Brocadiia bacterium]
MNRLAMAVAAAMALAWAASADEGKNLLANPSFEDLAEGKTPAWAAAWSPTTYKGAEAVFAVDEKVFHSGKRSMSITTAKAGSFAGVESRPAAVQVEEGARMRVTVWIRAEDTKGAVILVGSSDTQRQFQWTQAFSFEGPFDWKPFTAVIPLRAGVKKVYLSLRQSNEGKVWFDDAEAVLLKPGEDAEGGKKKVE